MNHIAFIQYALQHTQNLATWLYLLGVTGDQFETVFLCPKYKNIHQNVCAYDRYTTHLRKVLLALDDENVHAYIKIPREWHDNLSYGVLHRISDNKFLQISYNGVDGIRVSNTHNLLLGGVPPVNIHPELTGNYSFIDKQQRDLLFTYADNLSVDINHEKYERITDGTLTPERLEFLSNICIQFLMRKWSAESKTWTSEEIHDCLSKYGWSEKDIEQTLARIKE